MLIYFHVAKYVEISKSQKNAPKKSSMLPYVKISADFEFDIEKLLELIC